MHAGIQVQRIAVVPDEHDDILAEVRDQVRERECVCVLVVLFFKLCVD